MTPNRVRTKLRHNIYSRNKPVTEVNVAGGGDQSLSPSSHIMLLLRTASAITFVFRDAQLQLYADVLARMLVQAGGKKHAITITL